MVFCKKCGRENKSGEYCRYCGEKLIQISFFKKFKVLLIFASVIVFLLMIQGISTLINKENFIQREIIDLSTKKVYCGDSICSENEKYNCKADCEWCGDGRCKEDELFKCKQDCIWCGDGTCQKEEVGSCFNDCEWCGDGYCQGDESCSSCSKDCGNCKAKLFCGDGFCSPGECQSGCSKDCSTSECENGICEKSKGENCVNAPNDCRCNINEGCNQNTKLCETITCGDGRCDFGETSASCPNDCKEGYIEQLTDPNKDFSIVFVHGHSSEEVEGYQPTKLEEFQQRLVSEGYENRDMMLPSDYPPILTKGIWSGKKVSVIMTYYANRYDKGDYIVGLEDNQPIRVYAQRLRDVVEVIKHNTGKSKVIIIAHSMGGLVSRAYIKYYGGLNSVDKLVTIGTPNHGTNGIVTLGCGTLLAGRNPTPECEDMNSESKVSTFLRELNSNDETPGGIRYLTIVGRNKKYDLCPGDKYWDNVICASSVPLNGAENFIYDDFSEGYSFWEERLHISMVKPSKAPEVYNKIVEFIKS